MVPANDRDAVKGTEVVDQDPEWPGFRPEYFGVTRAGFGYDAAIGAAVPVVMQDGLGAEEVIPITVSVLLLDSEAASSGALTDENHCEVVMTSTDTLPVSAWAGGSGAWFAFELTESVGTTTCGSLDFDPSVWGDDAVHTHVTKWAWGAGLNDLTVDAVDIMGDQYPALEPWVQGGGFYWEELPDFVDAKDPEGIARYDADGYVDAGITFAYLLDEEHRLAQDGGEKVLIPAESVLQPYDEVATAYYEVQMGRFLSPAHRLTMTP